MSYNFGNNIKTLRKNRNLTQEQMAEFLGVSSQAISKWETNISYPDISLLPIIANFFGVSTDELLGYDMSKRDDAINDLQKEADKLCEAGKYSEAVVFLRNALIKYPGNDKLMYKLAWALTGTIKEQPDNLDEAIILYLKILEISTDTALRAKATRDLIYRYYTKGENDVALDYANQLPLFEVCREYNLGRANLLEGRELSEYLQRNIRLFGKAMIECLEYFVNDSIISAKDRSPYTPEVAKEKIEMLEVLTSL